MSEVVEARDPKVPPSYPPKSPPPQKKPDAGHCGLADPAVLKNGITGIQTSQPGISAHCSKWRHGTCGPGLDESCEPRWTL
ncbi:hypothetical protein ABZ605_11790 [Streptomyces sp. NPDC012765]|uniref:hypothetical protein n=1 Tax=Streptomyces sp. NPDC012765 TaxID=3155249 RepID=UPI0033DFD4F6